MKINSLFSKDDKLIIKLSFIVCIILSIISLIVSIFVREYPYIKALSIPLGYASSLICYIKLVIITTNVTNHKYQNPKKAFVINNITSFLLYAIVLLLSVLIKAFNIFLTFLGIMIIKIIIFTCYYKNKEKEV